jgi:hypothetical protein
MLANKHTTSYSEATRGPALPEFHVATPPLQSICRASSFDRKTRINNQPVVTNANFKSRREEMAAGHGERLCRMWGCYLLQIAAFFRGRRLNVVQLVLTAQALRGGPTVSFWGRISSRGTESKAGAPRRKRLLSDRQRQQRGGCRIGSDKQLGWAGRRWQGQSDGALI